jgi:prepilin-type processing-associated H-X9-DG protein
LAELLIVVCIVGVLLGLMVPALAAALNFAEQTSCAANLHYVGVATQMYLKDHDGWFFPLQDATAAGGKTWYYGFETSQSAASAWGTRKVDLSKGKLAPYIGGDESVGTCTAVRSGCISGGKYAGWTWSYGVNAELTGPVGATKTRNFSAIRSQDVGYTALFADSAQINTWEAPASRQKPLVEEWFYIQTGARFVHFRHNGLANVLFADWHVEAVGPAAGSLSPLLPSARIGYFDSNDILLTPRG